MYFLGVDSGGSKTSFVLADAQGRVRARHRSGSGGFLSSGEDRIGAMLAEGVAAVCQRAGITPARIAAAALGFPGYGEAPGSAAALDRLVAAVLGPGRATCSCDSYLGWAGSLALEPGINIIAGTGSICYGVRADGATARSSGWGAYCDEGSCRWLGSRLIQAFTQQADGRRPRTALYELFRTHYQLSDDLHFIGPLNHELGGDGARTARLQVLLKEIYDAGDPVAAALYRQAAAQLHRAIRSVARQLGLLGQAHRVSYSGGLFRAGACILDPLRHRVEATGATLRPPRFEPDLGAVLVAMRRVTPGLDLTTFAFTE